jgi:hypothetical protein
VAKACRHWVRRPEATFVSVSKRLAFPIELLLTALECGFASVVCVASASAEVVSGCNWRLRQMTTKRPADKHEPAAKAAPPRRQIADVIELAGKRKHER